MSVSKKLCGAALCLGLSGLLHAQSGTANGSYDFSGIGSALNSGGTGSKTQGDKFVVSNIMANPGKPATEMFANNTVTGTGETVIIQSNGSAVRSFLLKDVAVRNASGNFPLSQFTVTVSDAYGNVIATHSLAGGNNQSMRSSALRVSGFGLSPAWPAAGYPYAASVKIQYRYVAGNRAPSNLRFVNWTLADISSAPPPFVRTGAADAGTYCAGAPISVAFSGGKNFASGNVYTLQLSDASGSFANPVAIGSLSSDAASGSISGIIPATAAEGSGYRVRITGGAPAYVSLNNNGTDLRIRARATVSTVPDQLLCSGALTAEASFSGTQATAFSWTNDNASIGLDASGSGAIPSFVTGNNSHSVQTATITVTPHNNGCAGIATSFRISVKPTPDVNAVGDLQGCSSGTVSAAFTGAVPGTVFSWTNDNTGIGLGGSGTGDLSFTGSAAATPQTARITVATVADGCPGGSTSFAITVNPALSATIAYPTGPITERSGIVYATHTGSTGGSYRSTPGLAIDAATGAIDIATSAPGTYTVTYAIPVSGGCGGFETSTQVNLQPFRASISYPGAPYCGSTGTGIASRTGTSGGTFSALQPGLAIDAQTGAIDVAASAAGTYTVRYSLGADYAQTEVAIRPAVLITPTPNQALCAGGTTTAVTLTGAPGLSFRWTNNNTSVGLAASGTDIVPAFATPTGGTSPVTATLTVAPEGGTGCTLNKVMVYRYTVKPTPSVNPVPDQSVCAGTASAAVTLSGPVAGTSYGWSNNNSTIGLAPMGSGSIGSFLAVNNGGLTQTATVTVTSQANGCAGQPLSFTYAVAPVSGSISYSGSPYCQSGSASPVRVGPAGGLYSATPAGLSLNATTGQVNLAASAPGIYTVNYIVGVSGSCGASASTSLTIKPIATVNPVPNQVFCQNVLSNALAFTGTGTSFSWTNDNSTIGLAASGINSLPAFLTVNNSGVTQTATIRVIPSGGSGYCSGKGMVFRFSVNACGTSTTTRTATTAPAPEFSLSPNPAQGAVMLQAGESDGGSYTVQVLSQQGIPAAPVQSFTGRSYTLNTSMLTPGVYVVQIVNLKTKAVARKQLFKL